MLRRDSPTPREHMSERLWMRDRMTLLHSVCHHHEFVKTSHRGSHETCSPQVLTEPSRRERLSKPAKPIMLVQGSVWKKWNYGYSCTTDAGRILPTYPASIRLKWFANRGASSSAAKIYRKDALFGPIPVGFRVVQPLIAEYGVLTWRAKDNVLSARPSPRSSLSRPSARRAGDWVWRKEAH